MTARRPYVEPRGLNREQAAAYIGVGTTMFDDMVKDGRMPGPVRIGARVVWDRFKLDAAFDNLAGTGSSWDDVA